MKFLIVSSFIALLFSVPQKAISQNGALLNLMAGAANMKAQSIERSPHFPGIIQLKGSVEITTKINVNDAPLSLMIMVVRADEADYHEDTGEIEARGSVQVNYRDDPTDVRAGNVRIKLEKMISK
jgi:hypothetical protein